MNTATRLRGFSLVEILVVITIIAIVMSITLLSLGILGDDRDLRQEGRRIIALIGVAQDDAVMQGREFGLEFTISGYRFVEFDARLGAWTEIVGDDTLRLRQLPEDTEFDLFVEGQRVLLDPEPVALGNSDDEDDDSLDPYTPHVLIFSSGDMTPFELHIVQPQRNQTVVLQGDLLGDIGFADQEFES